MNRPRYLYVGIGLVLLGLAGGYFYWYNWGCVESCPIDSSWKLSLLRGGLIGLCLALIFAPQSSKKADNESA